MTPTIRITSIIISLSDKSLRRPHQIFSEKSWPGQFSRSEMTGAWHRVLHVTRGSRDGARDPAPKSRARDSLSISSGQAGLDWVGPEWDEMTIRETARTITDSRDPSPEEAGAKWSKETSSWNLIFQWHSSDVENVNFSVKLFRDALFDWIYKILVAKIAR